MLVVSLFFKKINMSQNSYQFIFILLLLCKIGEIVNARKNFLLFLIYLFLQLRKILIISFGGTKKKNVQIPKIMLLLESS